MVTLAWIIQSNLLPYKQILPIVNALEEEGIPFMDVAIIPFSDEPLNIPEYLEIKIPYGSTSLIKRAIKEKWKGLYFTEQNFRVDTWNANRDDMLNQDAVVMSVTDTYKFFENSNEESWFIRPVDDLKTFSGYVLRKEHSKEWFEKIEQNCESFDISKEIAISRVKKILAEWRYFVADGKIIDGSMYRCHDQMRKIHETDKDVLKEAQEFADKWLPDKICVMDIMLTDEGVKIGEFNCFHASGFYDHDLNKIVREITNFIKTSY